MKNRELKLGILFVIIFIIWTLSLLIIDVKPLGVNQTNIGLSSINVWFHQMTGTNMFLYILTDWLGLVPVFVCLCFGLLGCIQLIKRRSLIKVDYDLIVLGIYYIVVIFSYLLFEKLPINYRPILIEGRMEVSYPSSTTLLVLSVMLSLYEQVNRRVLNIQSKNMIHLCIVIFTVFMIGGRFISGVHWVSDIIGSILISIAYYSFYKGVLKWNFMKNFKNYVKVKN